MFEAIAAEKVKLPASTTELSKAASTEYLDKIAAMTGAPLLDPQAAGYLLHRGLWRLVNAGADYLDVL